MMVNPHTDLFWLLQQAQSCPKSANDKNHKNDLYAACLCNSEAFAKKEKKRRNDTFSICKMNNMPCNRLQIDAHTHTHLASILCNNFVVVTFYCFIYWLPSTRRMLNEQWKRDQNRFLYLCCQWMSVCCCYIGPDWVKENQFR